MVVGNCRRGISCRRSKIAVLLLGQTAEESITTGKEVLRKYSALAFETSKIASLHIFEQVKKLPLPGL
jgi:hypothetical protein